MISRLTAFAASFAILASASIAVAASAHQATVGARAATAKVVRVVELERVTIVAKRLAPEAR